MENITIPPDPPTEEGYLMIFDLSTTPMTLYKTIHLPRTVASELYTLGDYIVINSGKVLMKLNKHTLNIEAVIDLQVGRLWAMHDSTYVILLYNYIYDDVVIVFQETYHNEQGIWEFGDFIPYRLYVDPDVFPQTMKVIDDYVYIHSHYHIGIYDISDIYDFKEVISVFEKNFDLIFQDSLIYENYLIATYATGMRVYDISDKKNPALLLDKFLNVTPTNKNLLIYEGRLYVTTSDYIAIYDLLNDFERIDTYGNLLTDLSMSNGMVIENFRNTSEIRIYSLLDEYIENITINKWFDSELYRIGDFQINDNLLYIISTFDFTTGHLNIYDFDKMSMICQIDFDHTIHNINLMNDYIVITQSRGFLPSINRVYVFENNDLMYKGMFEGNIGTNSTGGIFGDYFIVSNGSRVEFRSVKNPLDILSTVINQNFAGRYIAHLKENSIGINVNQDISQFFKYNDEFTNFTQTVTHQHPRRIRNFFNGYMIVNGFNTSLTEFYSIDDAIPRKIGEMDIHRVVLQSFLFPEEKKLIQRTGAGIHVYDIDYTVSEKEYIIPYSSTRLHGNFPNPFNPETTIQFSIGNVSASPNVGNVEINVYNVRGQLVRKLIDDYFEVGTHTVEWNGKDDDGRNVGSGIYFYQMRVGDSIETKRMVLLK
jgi:hypothetical protein